MSGRAFLTFRAGGSRYAILAESVREVARPRRIVPLPGSPETYAGLGLLRGEPLGLLDVARAMGRGKLGPTPFALALEGRAAALLVDRVDGVVTVEPPAIQQAPGDERGPAHGEARIGGETITIVSPERLLRPPQPVEEPPGLPAVAAEDPS
jgi:chemotaxis signal transduction protein